MTEQPPVPPPAPTPPAYGVYPVASPAPLPLHEHASLSLGLGVIGLVGACAGVGLLLSPFALAFGISARRAVIAEPERWRGADLALAGAILGGIGTVLLVLAILGAVAFATLLLAGVASTGNL